METLLQKNLRPGETVLWSAKPEGFKTMDATYKTPIIKKFSIMLLVVAALTGWYLYAVSAKGDSVKVLELLACVSPFLCVWTDFADARKLKKQVLYALTDQRLLCVNGKQLQALDYKQILCYDVVTDAAGHASLICGEEAMKAKDETRRETAVGVAHLNVDTNLCENFAMYGITEHANEVRGILAKYAA